MKLALLYYFRSMNKNKKLNSQNTYHNLIIYQAPSGEIQLQGDFGHETVWATQDQIVKLFQKDQSVISRHIKSIFKDGEVDQKSNMQKVHIANSDKPVAVYSLDVILSVGYRTNSARAIEFRKWASSTLKEYLMKGYIINKKHIQKNYREFLKTIETIKQVLPADSNLDPKVILDLVKEFSSTWTSLDSYDKESLEKVGKNITSTQKAVTVSASELLDSIAILRTNLIKKGETTEIFAHEREQGSIEGILGNIMQSFYGKPVYKSAEEKSAHLLYFIIKNHPFVDGNKRTGAWAFIWFMRKMRVAGYRNINPATLTALTLLIAQSSPDSMDQMIALVTNLVVG